MNAFKWHDSATPGGLPLLETILPDAAPHKVPRRALETRRAYKRVETEPGMDKFAENVGKLGQTALEPLLEWSRAVIPRNSWANTPVFLLGTAGLRKLNEKHRERVMNEARNFLSHSGFRFESSWARVLGGNDEGIYAWVALNAAEGKLGTENTLGALDLGGSSLQVTFAMDHGEEKEENEIIAADKNGSVSIQQRTKALAHAAFAVNVSLLGTHHTLYTHSHYHFGLDDAFERSVSLLLEEKNRRKNTEDNKKRRELLLDDLVKAAMGLEHPCLHKGYTQLYTRIPLEGRIPSPATVTLLGKPDANLCSQVAQKIVTSSSKCDAPPCALGTPQPRAAGKFIALAGFYVVSHFFNLGANAGVKALAKMGTEFCPLTWSEVQSRHPGEMAVETYCFRTAYISALIPQGLGLKEDQVEIGQGTAGWTLGAALMEGHRHAGLGVGVTVTDTAGGGGVRNSGFKRNSITTRGASKISSVSQWAGNLPPSWKDHHFAAAGVSIFIFVLVGIVLAYRRGQNAVARALRVQGWLQIRRRSSSGILSAAEFGSEDLGNSTGNSSSSGFLRSVFFRLFGGAAKATSGKKASPTSIWQQEPGTGSSEHGLSMVAVGSARSLGLTRSATYSRRLSTLESASSERGG
jgi:apyrase